MDQQYVRFGYAIHPAVAPGAIQRHDAPGDDCHKTSHGRQDEQ
jgi:hypothetical protein